MGVVPRRAVAVCLLMSVLFLVAYAEQPQSGGVRNAEQALQGAPGARVPDGRYSGSFGQVESGRVQLEFAVQDNRLFGLRYIELQHGRRDFLRDHHDPWVLGVYLQYQAALEHLEGRPFEEIHKLANVYALIGPNYELLETCSAVDGASAATVRGSAVMEAILNGL